MRESFPDLRILSSGSLLLQEQLDVQRVGTIIECLRAEGVLRDPPIVATVGSSSLRYLVLDGTECVIALRRMQVPHILGQVVAPGSVATARALRVNYPLTELMDGKTLADKNSALQQWIRARMIDKAIRCYEEATILFDD